MKKYVVARKISPSASDFKEWRQLSAVRRHRHVNFSHEFQAVCGGRNSAMGSNDTYRSNKYYLVTNINVNERRSNRQGFNFAEISHTDNGGHV